VCKIVICLFDSEWQEFIVKPPKLTKVEVARVFPINVLLSIILKVYGFCCFRFYVPCR